MKNTNPESKNEAVPSKDFPKNQTDTNIQEPSNSTQTQFWPQLPQQGLGYPLQSTNPRQVPYPPPTYSYPPYPPPTYIYRLPPPNSQICTDPYIQTAPRNIQNSPMSVNNERDEGGKDENIDVEQELVWSRFEDKEVRKSFVRKVYIILTIQLIVSLGIILLFTLESHVKDFVKKHAFIYWIALALFIGIYIGIACCGNLRRQYPTNVILLSIFTLATSVMMGVLSSFHDVEAVAMAVGICAAVTLLVSLLSFWAKCDITNCGGILCILLLILIVFGIAAALVHSKTMQMIYAGLGAMVFTLYLAFDTQALMGGKTVEISPEEYIFAAMQIYVDIAYIFMHLLMLIGLTNNG